MTNLDHDIQAKLAPPGAGIPFYVQLFNRFFLKPFVVRKVPWIECEAQFAQVHGKILHELEGLTEEELLKRVLVPPQLALEDSSRYWSIAMTIRHLTIVGQKMEKVIVALTHEIKIPEVADTAKVKPENERNEIGAIEEYKAFASDVIQRIQLAVGNRQSKSQHPHPWFGAFTAKDWLWLMGTHTGIHLKQIRRIKSEVRKKPT